MIDIANKTAEQRAEIARQNGRQGGKPYKYTPAELEAKIDQYFADHNSNDSKPDWDDMLRYLGLSKSTTERYLHNEDYIQLGYDVPIKRAIGYFTTFWTKYGLDHPNTQTFCIFMLKQVHYGGYGDKQVSESNNKSVIELKISGID